MKKKIVYATFQDYRNTRVSSAIGMTLQTLCSHSLNICRKVQFYVFRKNTQFIEDKHIKPVLTRYDFIYLCTYIFSKLGIKYHFIRHWQEIHYDFRLSKKLHKGTDILITSEAWIPRTMKKARKYGIETLFIPGNPNDEMIYEIVASEKKKLSLNYIDPYDYIPRLDTYKKTIQYFDHIIAINSIFYNTYASRGYKNVHLLPFIPSNINDIKQQILVNTQDRQEHIRIGFLAHIVLLKGLHYLLDAVSKFSQREYILIIGGGIESSPYKEEIEKRIVSLGKHIKMLGNIKNKEDFFNQIDILVIPSIIEGMPKVLYESLERGMPVMATDKCGGRDVIDEGKNGFIVPSADAQEIYKKLAYYKDNKSSFSREQIITDFKNKTKYSHEKFVNNFHSYIQNLHNE